MKDLLMNLFKSLDNLFPVGANRTSGEVVSCDIQIGDLRISDKRKAWYVNASVNAFHMHRSLVRQFKESTRFQELSFADDREVKRLIVLCVLNSYVANYRIDSQYHSYSIISPDGHTPSRGSWSAWWVVDALDWREVGDWTGKPLLRIIEDCSALQERKLG